MTNNPVLYIVLLIIVAIIFGFAKSLGFNLDATYGDSWGKKNLEKFGIDDDKNKEYRD